MSQTKIFKMSNIHNSLRSHDMLAFLFTDINEFDGEQLILDFHKVTFISANQFASLGCILAAYHKKHPDVTIVMDHASPALTSIMRVNGFGKHFAFPAKPDTYNTSIPYRIFSVNDISEFEKYITMNIFSRNDLPKMDQTIQDGVIDNILEIFNNVKEHTNCSTLYTCGQYFPSKSLLYFTIADSGETIPNNVQNFLFEHNIEINTSLLEWAMQSGNSTRRANLPGGLGLYFLSTFISQYAGELFIVSANETYEQTLKGTRYKYLDHSFNGTIVTMASNLNPKVHSSLIVDSNDFIF